MLGQDKISVGKCEVGTSAIFGRLETSVFIEIRPVRRHIMPHSAIFGPKISLLIQAPPKPHPRILT